MENNAGTRFIRTTCVSTDFYCCGLEMEVIDGVISNVRPADFPDTRDKGACLRGMATRELVYHKNRVRYPMKRVGQRGEGQVGATLRGPDPAPARGAGGRQSRDAFLLRKARLDGDERRSGRLRHPPGFRVPWRRRWIPGGS